MPIVTRSLIRAVSAITIAVAAAAPTSVHATPVTFFGQDINPGPALTVGTVHPNSDAARASFFSNLTGGVGTETFESIAVGTTNPAISFQGAGTATILGSGSVQSGTTASGQFPISGNRFYNAGTGDFAISFSSAISAFGFYGTDVGDFGGQLTLTLQGGGTTTLTVPNAIGHNGSTSGSALYFGFYDTSVQYTKISFGNSSQGNDVFGFDDFSVGSLAQVAPTVPEPASIGLLLVALAGLTVVIRARSPQRNRPKPVTVARQP